MGAYSLGAFPGIARIGSLSTCRGTEACHDSPDQLGLPARSNAVIEQESFYGSSPQSLCSSGSLPSSPFPLNPQPNGLTASSDTSVLCLRGGVTI